MNTRRIVCADIDIAKVKNRMMFGLNVPMEIARE
ncbi:MAG: hypothetical protein BWY44_00288 [Candidatus Omnitrophica bacterium ADurb.Bin292]|jgi:hypothetical protein|nr:MAG: hypothetical protein BWY44_00288 [Candidatus Omnitrophica bacterium ADurb.Bin292]